MNMWRVLTRPHDECEPRTDDSDRQRTYACISSQEKLPTDSYAVWKILNLTLTGYLYVKYSTKISMYIEYCNL